MAENAALVIQIDTDYSKAEQNVNDFKAVLDKALSGIDLGSLKNLSSQVSELTSKLSNTSFGSNIDLTSFKDYFTTLQQTDKIEVQNANTKAKLADANQKNEVAVGKLLIAQQKLDDALETQSVKAAADLEQQNTRLAQAQSNAEIAASRQLIAEQKLADTIENSTNKATLNEISLKVKEAQASANIVAAKAKEEAANQRLANLQENANKVIIRQGDNYKQLSEQYRLLSRDAQDYAAKLVLEGQSLEQLKANSDLSAMTKSAKQAYDQLVMIDESVGKFGRGVGNYKSHWDGLGNALRQSLREVPSTLSNFNMMALALSNNLPILGDEISKVIEKNKALRAEGKPTTSVLSQIAGSLFSWQTGLLVGIALLTQYSNEIADWISELVHGEHQISATEEAQKDLQEVVKNGGGVFAEAMKSYQESREALREYHNGVLTAKQATNVFNNTLGDNLGKVKSVDEAERKLNDHAQDFVRAQFLRAVATQALNSAVKAQATSIADARKSSDQYVSFWDKLSNAMSNASTSSAPNVGRGVSNILNDNKQTGISNKAKQLKKDNDEVNAQLKVFSDYMQRANKLAKAGGFNIDPNEEEKTRKGRTKKPRKAKLTETQKAYEEYFKSIKQINGQLNSDLPDAKITEQKGAEEKLKAIDKLLKTLVENGVKLSSVNSKVWSDAMSIADNGTKLWDKQNEKLANAVSLYKVLAEYQNKLATKKNNIVDIKGLSANTSSITKYMRDRFKEVQKDQDKAFKDRYTGYKAFSTVLPLEGKSKDMTDNFRKWEKLSKKLAQNLKEGAGSAVNSLVQGLFQGQNALQGLENAAAGLVSKLVAAAAEAAVLKALGFVTSGGGTGFLDIFGSILGGRAGGGSVEKGGLYRVNEFGSELLNMGGKQYLMAGANGQVKPISQPQYSYGQGYSAQPIRIEVHGKQRGSDIYYSGNNYERTKNR